MYLVKREGECSSHKAYEHYSSALNDAETMAKLSPGSKFFIYESLEVVEVINPIPTRRRVEEEDLEDEVYTI